jgi:hypothetical protein
MSPASGPPQENELQPLAEEVNSELRMLLWAASQLHLTADSASHEPTDPDLAVARAAIVEVFLLHLRNLVDFFRGPPTRDDVSASQYGPWSLEAGGANLGWLLERLPSIHKRLAHVTAYRRRIVFEEDTFNVEDVVPRVLSVWRCFCGLLDAERQGWFDVV